MKQRKKKSVQDQKKRIQTTEYRQLRKRIQMVLCDPSEQVDLKTQINQERKSIGKCGSVTRIRRRCLETHSARSVIGCFRRSGLSFREKALKGEIPGVSKFSW